MILLRTTILIFGTAVAYALLRGWPESMPPIIRACGAVLVLVAALGLWARRGRDPGPAAGARRPPGAMDYLAIVAVVLAVECGFLWVLSALPRPLETAALGVEERLRPQAAAARTEAAADGGGPVAGNWLWNDQTRRPLPRRTNFKPGNRPEVFIRLRDRGDAAELLRGQVYVRSFALGRYERAAWSPSPAGSPRVLEADAAGFVQLPERPGRAIVHEVFHSADPGGQNSLTALHGVVAAQVPRLVQVGEGLHLLPPAASEFGYEYVAASAPLRLEDLLNRGGEVRVPAVVLPELLALPELGILGPRLRELAGIAAGTGDLPRRLLNLQNHLRTTLAYSLETTNERDLDPLENFLFHEQRGHCEFFATAGALLARAIGVPSRTAYGWAGGTYYESTNMFVFRAREAHAWTEILLDGQGWVAMDPTPPAAIGGELARVARPDELPPTADGVFADEESLATGPNGDLERAALLLMACFGLPAAVVLAGRRLFTRRRQEGATASAAETLPAPDYLRAWRRASARRGVPMKPGVTLRRHLACLAQEVPFSTELLAYHYGTRYEGHPPDPKIEKRLVGAIRKWETAGAADQTSILNSSR